MRLRDYVQLYKLARRRQNSPQDYFSFQRYQGELLIRFLRAEGITIADRNVLDLGTGLGGYSSAFSEAGANVTGIDLFSFEASRDVAFVCADVRRLPFTHDQFDLILSASLVEHIPSPKDLLYEIMRVLRRNGVAYISFPPFYTPFGGHQFSPFHLLGERLAVKALGIRNPLKGKKWLEQRYPHKPSSYAGAFGNWGIYPLTIGKFEKCLKELHIKITDRSIRWIPINFTGIPILRELFTWHVQFLVRKL